MWQKGEPPLPLTLFSPPHLFLKDAKTMLYSRLKNETFLTTKKTRQVNNSTGESKHNSLHMSHDRAYYLPFALCTLLFSLGGHRERVPAQRAASCDRGRRCRARTPRRLASSPASECDV